MDNALPSGNMEGLGSGNAGVNVTYDITPPTSSIVSPINNTAYNSLNTITGTVQDLAGLRTEIQIFDLGGQSASLGYYNGAGDWQSTAIWLSTENASGFTMTPTNWNYVPNPVISWKSGNKYLVVSRSRDAAGNLQNQFAAGTSSNTFVFDTQPPVSALTVPSSNITKTLADISGTSSDATQANYAGISAVAARINITVQDLTYPNTYWQGAAWGVGVSTFHPSGINAIAGPAVSWYRTGVGWISDRQYSISYWAQDDLGNTSNVSSYSVIYDTTPPTSGIIYPANLTKFNYAPTISGTANAFLSGLAEVDVQISSWTGAGWYTVTSWSPSSVSITGSTWTYSGFGTLNSGTTYQVQARALDLAGNYDTILSTVDFIYSTQAPQTGIGVPVSGGFYGPANTLTSITGTATDPFGVSTVYLQIQRSGDNKYWDGNTSWVAGSSWIVTTYSINWSYSNLNLQDGYIYTLNSKALDLAGNLSGWTTTTFTYDSTLPQVVLQQPTTSYLNSLPVISGTAFEPAGTVSTNRSGLSKVEVAIEYNPDGNGNWWNPGTHNFDIGNANSAWFNVTGNLAGVNGPVTWSVPSASTPTWVSNTKYLVKARATDRSQNISTGTVTSQSFVYDTGGSAVQITVPSLSSYPSLPTISGTASDSNSLDSVSSVFIRIYNFTVTQYWSNSNQSFTVSNANNAWFTPTNASGNWNVWVETFTWSSGNEYQIEAVAQDNSGNFSVTYSTVVFRYDNQPPNTFVTQPANGTFIRSLATISGTAGDIPPAATGTGYGGTGLSQIEVAIRDNSNQSGTPWWGGASFNQPSPQPFLYTGAKSPEPVTWTYTGLTGANLVSGTSYYATACSLDNATNQESFLIRGSTFVYDTTPAVSSITVPSSAYYSVLNTISGTAQDYPGYANGLAAGVQSVSVAICRMSDGAQWQGSGDTWSGTTYYMPTSGTNNWTLSTLPPWASGQKYRITSQSVDNALPSGNVETNGSMRYFIFDSSAPGTAIVSPIAGGYYGQLNAITGTAQDYPTAPFNSGLNSAAVRILRVSDSYEWTGSSWTSPGANWWNPASLISGNWQYTSVPQWQSGFEYTVQSMATDNIGNAQNPVTSSSFWFDNAPPNSFVTLPTENEGFNLQNPLNTISGTAYAPASGVQNVNISIRLDNPPLDSVNAGVEDQWWSVAGSSWAYGNEASYTYPVTIYNRVGETAYWYYSGISSSSYVSGNIYRIHTKAEDYVQYPGPNYETPASTRSFTVNNIPPTSNITYPVNEQYYTSLGTISGTAVAASPTSSGVTETDIQIYSANYGYWNGSNWQVSPSTWIITTSLAQANTSWQFTQVPTWISGQWYELNSRSIDSANNVENAALKSWVTVGIDTAPPNVVIITPQNNQPYMSLPVITGTALSDLSGVKNVSLVIEDLFTGQTWNKPIFQSGINWTNDVVGTTTWECTDSIPYTSGKQYLVYAKGQDNAGNITSVYTVGVNSNTFVYDREPAQTNLVMPAAGNPTYNSITTISGTSTDITAQPAGFVSGVKEEHILISYLSGGATYYWTGGNPYSQYWSSSSYPTNGLVVATSGGWSYTNSQFANSSAWTTGITYTIQAWSVDNAGNIENPPITRNFQFDNVDPTIGITMPNPGATSAYNNLAQIAGTAADAYCAVTKVELTIQDVTSGTTYYNGSSWVNNPGALWFNSGSAGTKLGLQYHLSY